MNKNIKVLAIISLILFGLSIVFFSSYAIFGLVLSTDNSSITTGQIKMSYTETNEIGMKNALPITDTDGKELDTYFDFQILTYIKTNANDSTKRKINYNIVIEPLAVDNKLNDSEIKVYLTKIENGTETLVVPPVTIDKLNNYILKSQEETFSNAKNEVITSYRLRAWIDKDVDTNKFNDKSYSYKFRVNVNNDTASLKNISVKQPTKTTYAKGEKLSLDGFYVQGLFSDDSMKTITDSCSLSDVNMNTTGNKNITVTCNVNGIIKTSYFSITVVDTSSISIDKTSSGVLSSISNDTTKEPKDSVILVTTNYKYTYNDFMKLSSAEKMVIYQDIKNPYVITAPHSVKQLREGSIKARDLNTGEMCIEVAKKTNSVCVTRQAYDETDPNYYGGGIFVSLAKDLGTNTNAILNMDLHGIASSREFGFAIGTRKGSVLSSKYKCIDKALAEYLHDKSNEPISVNTYSGCDYGSASYLVISDSTLQGGMIIQSGIAQNSIQLEMKPNYRPGYSSYVASFILSNFK